MEQLLAYFAKEGRVVKDAPLAFWTGVALFGLIIWGVLTFINSERFSTLDERIKFKDDQIASLQGENTGLEALVADFRAAMDAMAERLKALEEKILTGVLEGAPASVELLTKPEGNSALAKLTGALKQSGWTVTPGVGTPATADVFDKTDTLAIIKAASPGASDTMKAALDAAEIPYEVRNDDGGEAIWLKSLGGAFGPSPFLH